MITEPKKTVKDYCPKAAPKDENQEAKTVKIPIDTKVSFKLYHHVRNRLIVDGDDLELKVQDRSKCGDIIDSASLTAELFHIPYYTVNLELDEALPISACAIIAKEFSNRVLAKIQKRNEKWLIVRIYDLDHRIFTDSNGDKDIVVKLVYTTISQLSEGT